MKTGIRKKGGFVLVTALVIAFVMTLWVVAALYRNSFMTSAAIYSHQKTEAYFLAKRAISRSLYFLNADGSWTGSHNSRSNADTTTPDTLTWIENTSSGRVLKCEAKVGRHSANLTVPIKLLDDGDTHLYSVSPSSGGPDVIAWKPADSADWDSLPPIPGVASIVSVTGTGNGDVYSVATGSGGESILWRYRQGRGWVKLPQPPAGVSISNISVAQSQRLVSLGSDNKIHAMRLDQTLEWEEVSSPQGFTITDVTIPLTDTENVYTTSQGTRGSAIHQYNFGTGQWTELSVPDAAHFSPGGILLSESGTVPNFGGGLTVDNTGDIFAASNPPGEPSVIYQFQTPGPGATSGDWRVLPPVPNYHYDDAGNVTVDSYATELRDLNCDDDGNLWVQWQSPFDETFSTLLLDTSAI